VRKYGFDLIISRTTEDNSNKITQNKNQVPVISRILEENNQKRNKSSSAIPSPRRIQKKKISNQ
jgi:hypothetical protein